MRLAVMHHSYIDFVLPRGEHSLLGVAILLLGRAALLGAIGQIVFLIPIHMSVDDRPGF